MDQLSKVKGGAPPPGTYNPKLPHEKIVGPFKTLTPKG